MSEHGTRTKYVSDKCRCEPCTIANRIYARERLRHQARVRYGIEQPRIVFIDATETRDHLRWLSSVGVGKRQVAQRSGIGLTAIEDIRTGRVTKIRPGTADKLLAVGRSAAADGALIDAKPTWKLINDLLKHGWTKCAISKAIGNNGRSLQIGRKRVTAGTARKIRDFHDHALFRVVEQRRLTAERQARYRTLKDAA